ncbi:MAG: hypothetical protein MUC98_00905 [Desulfobacterota bacterium]|jgi:hypothetical protein|nr:hypothetical protein [Thermodesulfobacteriota bacterium]
MALLKKEKEKALKCRTGMDLPKRRFGFIGIEKGFINADHLYEALLRQRAQETGSEERRLLGMILKDLGYLSVSQVNEILQTLEREVQSSTLLQGRLRRA